MTETAKRATALKEEARGLQDALRPILGVEALGKGLLTKDERERMKRIRERLAAIDTEQTTLTERQRASHAERKRAAREAEERRLEEARQKRSSIEREQKLRADIIQARYERMNPRVGFGVGGQPRGHSVIVEAANRVEEELALMFNERAIELVGVPAVYIRDLQDDRAWGIKVKPGSSEIVAGSAPSPESQVRSPVPTPHQDWSGPSVPHLEG